MKIKLIFITILFSNTNCFSQIIFKNIENKPVKSTIVRLKQFLLLNHSYYTNSPTGLPDISDTNTGKFYRIVIDSFYNKQKMDSAFRNIEKKGGASYDQNLYHQYAVLNGMSKMLHCLPEDSIFIMGIKDFYKMQEIPDSSDFRNLDNIYIAGVIVKSNWYGFYQMEFDDPGRHFVYMLPILDFEGQNKGAEEFLKRYCNAFLKAASKP